MGWSVLWSQSLTGRIPMNALSCKNRTIRIKLSTAVSGKGIRLHMANWMGKSTYNVNDMTLWVKGTYFPVTCKEKNNFSLLPNTEEYSDLIPAQVNAGDQLELRFFTTSDIQDCNWIESGIEFARGNCCGIKEFKSIKPNFLMKWFDLMFPMPLVDRIELATQQPAKSIVVFGDSIVQMNRWTAPLQLRLIHEEGGKYVLANAGIGGNCLLYQTSGKAGQMWGISGQNRFDRDVLSIPNLETVVLALGTNDLAANPKSYSLDQIQEKYKAEMERLSRILRQKKIRVVAQTITPRIGEKGFTDEMEKARQLLNEWLRNCNLFDYVFDADAVVRDVNAPHQMDPRWHQGDWLHPNEAGGRRLAQAWPLEQLTGKMMP